MKIFVCMKQVPATTKVDIDPETGNLKRAGLSSRTNPYDLYALECALRIREQVGGTVTILTMGPSQAEEMIRDAYSMGADEGVIMSDRKFAGSDVLATSYTLSQGIRLLGKADLIICGRQTTDGDTAQIGPAIAEHLHIPHCAWVEAIEAVDGEQITLKQNFGSVTQVSRMHYPCLVTVDKDICVPRLPSYRLMQKTKDKAVRIVTYEDLPKKDLSRYGVVGSPTRVERIFAPDVMASNVYVEGTPAEKAGRLVTMLQERKYI
ncbi:electron transfer flavoprotein subunit beta/FixA family protein [Lacrimispora sp. 210928-DFI.3.58]|uniref:electron transfer flavoprotein subunit beta/FixA family protein n=1 Tax=Lacrimispora sp. 210928-DFI.3.58 TaxID=2883214 RepID=UPI0015B788A9|nr:electron transfer flavoprotein subunit beta/FixA family protein [Lacrimispora sp. 210928-DFI.3.58]MCB7319228.1 electron transfer flavoprotein subunit beta/FixA family protein [Lacrimispora sp. 210928-DFI.3.58]